MKAVSSVVLSLVALTTCNPLVSLVSRGIQKRDIEKCKTLTAGDNKGGRKIGIVIDESGSMYSADPYDLRVDAGRALNDWLISSSEAGDGKSADLVTVIGFDDTTRTYYSLGDPSGADDALDEITIVGGTWISRGVDAATAELNKSGNDPTADRSGIVVLTDGEDFDTEGLVDAINNAGSQGIRVSFGFLQSGFYSSFSYQDPEVLVAIINTGGKYANIDSYNAQNAFVNYMIANGLTASDSSSIQNQSLVLNGLSIAFIIDQSGINTLTYNAEGGEGLTFTITSVSAGDLNVTAMDANGKELGTTSVDSFSYSPEEFKVQASSNGVLQLKVEGEPDQENAIFIVGVNSSIPLTNCTLGDVKNSGLSTGAKAGIGVGVPLAVGLLATGLFFLWKYFQSLPASLGAPPAAPPVAPPGGAPGAPPGAPPTTQPPMTDYKQPFVQSDPFQTPSPQPNNVPPQWPTSQPLNGPPGPSPHITNAPPAFSIPPVPPKLPSNPNKPNGNPDEPQNDNNKPDHHNYNQPHQPYPNQPGPNQQPFNPQNPSDVPQNPSYPNQADPHHPFQPDPNHPYQPDTNHPYQADPSHPTQADPSHPTQTDPSHPTQADPSHPTQADPCHPTQADPSHPTQADPSHPTQADPSHPTQADPSHPTQADPNSPPQAGDNPHNQPPPTENHPPTQPPGTDPGPNQPTNPNNPQDPLPKRLPTPRYFPRVFGRRRKSKDEEQSQQNQNQNQTTNQSAPPGVASPQQYSGSTYAQPAYGIPAGVQTQQQYQQPSYVTHTDQYAAPHQYAQQQQFYSQSQYGVGTAVTSSDYQSSQSVQYQYNNSGAPQQYYIPQAQYGAPIQAYSTRQNVPSSVPPSGVSPVQHYAVPAQVPQQPRIIQQFPQPPPTAGTDRQQHAEEINRGAYNVSPVQQQNGGDLPELVSPQHSGRNVLRKPLQQ